MPFLFCDWLWPLCCFLHHVALLVYKVSLTVDFEVSIWELYSECTNPLKIHFPFGDTFLLGCEKISMHCFDVFSSEHMKGDRESDRYVKCLVMSNSQILIARYGYCNSLLPLDSNKVLNIIFKGWNCWQHIERRETDEKALSTTTSTVAWKAKRKG